MKERRFSGLKGRYSGIKGVKEYFLERPDIIAIFVLVVIMTAVKPVLAVPGIIVLIFMTHLRTDRITSRKSELYSQLFEDVATEMDDIMATSIIFNPFPLCMIDTEGKILWCNDNFKKLFPEESEVEDLPVSELTGVKIEELSNEELKDKSINITAIGRTFRVQKSEAVDSTLEDEGVSRTMYMLHWIDNTATNTLKKTYRDERPCIAQVNIDNLEDILERASDERKATLAGDIEKILRQWAVKCQGSIIRQSKSKFTVVLDNRNLEISEANKFPVLDEVRAVDTGIDIPASLSIGIGASQKNLAQTQEAAAAALDLALGRGGDQVVVKKASGVEYYGGKLMTVEKRNKGRSRIVAFALRQLIDQSPRVFVMGHKLPDMDSLGAALGIARMAKDRGKDTHIVIDSWDAVEMLYNLATEEAEHKFIASDYAKLIIRPEDLLIVVDTHRPSLCECAELTTKVEKLVIIDHHRRAEDMLANPILTHLEPYASSTSELVAEMLQYVSDGKKKLTAIEAEGLLSGIAVDSKNFSIKTGVRTFEAATWLRRQGADTTVVRQFFQTDLNLFKDKAGIISRAKRLPENMAISSTDGPKKNVSVLISMAADELLNIRGMRASFVVGQSIEGGLRVSARSLGDINVQLILEKIGGGGNLTTAGAQLEEIPVEDAVELIEEKVAEYLKEEEERKARAREKEQAKAAKVQQ